jgi:CelD/BcsL family acetyltransferase involved in cellulose biosynthesis
VLVPLTSRGEWEDACSAFPDATAFHRYDFLQSVAPSLRCRFVPLQVFFRGQSVGVAPLLVKRLGPFCTINWVPFPYVGPLVPPALIPATLSALTLEARRRRALNHQQSFSRAIADRPTEGFTSITDRTFVIPLSGRSDEDLMAAMQRGRRQQIHRAQRAGFEVCPAETEDLRLMDVWARQVYAAQGLRPDYRAGTYERLFGALRNASGSVFQVARLNGRTVAVDILFLTARRAFGWQAAVDPSHQSDHPQALLTWCALLWARDAGAIEFDLTGAPNEGIATYKRRFGALERHYPVLQRQAGLHGTALWVLSRLRST